MLRWLGAWGLLAVAWLLSICGLMAAFALASDRSAWVALLFYLPRVVFALPGLLLAALLWWRGPRRALVVVAAGLLLALGPLMGLHLSAPYEAPGGALTLLTYNVKFGNYDPQAIAQEIAQAEPDIAVLQSTSSRVENALAPLKARLPYVERVWSFSVHSRFPLRVVHVPKVATARLGPSYARFEVQVPGAPLELVDAHPHSPRTLLRRLGSGGRRALLLHGAGDPDGTLRLLREQFDEIAEGATSLGPRSVLAGDFNVPEGGPLVKRLFPRHRDAFAEAGTGYGYTFPAHLWLRWMRLDRVLVGPGLRAVSAHVVGGRGSDHAALVVQLAPR